MKLSRYTIFLKGLLGFLICFLVSACYQSDLPISPPDSANSDDRLLGVWHGSIEGNDIYLHIIHMEKPWLRLIRIVHVNHGGISENSELDMFPSVVGKDRFVNIKFPKTSDTKDEKGPPKDAYWFYKYEISSKGVMTVSVIDYPAIKECIDAGRLAGKAWESTWSTNVNITDSSERIRSFLVEPGEKQFKELGQFKRMQEVP